jgi:hypothetical protein
MRKESIEELGKASEEKFVEGIYRSEISRLRACSWITPDINASVDGYTEWKNTRFLLEAKLDENLKSRRDACNVLAQAVFYIRRFMDAGKTPPTVVMIADKNECFIVATSVLEKHTKMEINWKGAASKGNTQLSAALMKDDELKFFVHPVMQGFNLEEVLSHADAISAGQSFAITITPANISRVYQVWKEEGIVVDKIPGPLGSIMLFFEVIERGIEFIPRAGEKLSVGKFGEVTVKTLQLELFKSTYRTGYGYTESVALLAKRDQLMEDEARRFQGAFYTPEIWRDHAIEEITRVLGNNWTQDCVVWDCAAGTGNLTRDRKWGCLISSTAEKTDVDVMQRFQWGGTVFQYDFLNPDAESPFFEDGELSVIPPKVDKLLRAQAAAGKRLVFFMNPPYAEDGDAGATGTTKAGVAATTKVAEECRKAGMGRTSRQLYAQFMFQCRKVAEQYGFKDYAVALFSKPTFMTSGSYRTFRDWWYGAHKYGGGFLFQASHFADVSGAWGVLFTVWNAGGKTDPRATQPIRLCDERNFAVVTTGSKQVYNADGREASEWVEVTQKGHIGDTPKFSSGLKVAEKWDGGSVPGSLGVLCNKGNNLMESSTATFYLSGKPSDKGRRHFDLLPSNWRRAVALYGARKLVEGNWINDKDEYLAPDESKTGYDQWVNDCHVYALLHMSNNCTAMRDVQYKGKDWQIHNHWFWRTHQSVDALLRQRVSTKRLSRDAAVHTNDPYFAQLLQGGLELSEDAQHVLDYVNALWLLSLDDRESYAVQHPELHLMAWDAGIYQLKHLWRDYYSEKWEELKKAHKSLAERLQEGVYEYGFLKK